MKAIITLEADLTGLPAFEGDESDEGEIKQNLAGVIGVMFQEALERKTQALAYPAEDERMQDAVLQSIDQDIALTEQFTKSCQIKIKRN